MSSFARCASIALLLAACNSQTSTSVCPAGQHLAGHDCTSDPCMPSPCDSMHACAAQPDGTAACACPPGTHDVGGACVLDDGCSPTSCRGHGTCSQDASGAAVCACDPGWAEPRCSGCAAGFHDDGSGKCTGDPCTPNPCTGPNRRCVAQSGAATCACDAGYHDDNGACVPDTMCSPTSCNGHGTCMDGGGKAVCTCDAGWSGAACTGCDALGGYHSDGAGGCTKDPCTPNPCAQAHRTVCSLDMLGAAACGCDAGYHLDAGACVIDDTCQPASCSGHGTCAIVAGRVQCTCATGYTGANCGACAGGYHSDGAGGCTNDACVPNPCTAPHKTVCTAGACGCDAGYHDDGAGGCSNDPCTPNPCLASNQACRVSGGAAQCYTPPCDDLNPCTTDSVVGGNCVHSPLGDGTACQTSLCTVGQTCSGGACTGGSARSCDDANPCTDDSCSPTLGCQHANDDANVPSDGKSCTVDKCAGGVASHTPSNAACDDGLWCTGVEVCDPSGAGADANGCRHTNVPQPPSGAGPCRTVGACSEATHSFPLTPKGAGTTCDDGLSCTTGDQCDGTGACKGTAQPSCVAGGTCSGTTPLLSTIDVPYGDLQGTMTLAGAALPASYTDYTGGDFYLIAKDTGVRHYIGGFRYNYQAPGNYVLASNTYSARLVTGVYDLVYSRNCSPTTSCFDNVDSSLGPMVNGYRRLMTNVVIGPGLNQLNIDVPETNLSGTMTLAGGALPATYTDYTGGDFYMIAKDTGVSHYIGGFRYNYQSPGNYVLASNTYSARLLPGNYDLVYSRNCSATTSCFNNVDSSLGPMVNGYRLITANVSISGASQTLNIDVPETNLTGTMTLAGGALPAIYTDYTGGDFYMIAKDTGVSHYIGGFRYNYQSPGNYVLASSTYSARLLPGNYDLVYSRNCSATTSCFNNVDSSLGPMVNGYRLIAANVSISGANQTLNIDVPETNLTGTMTLAGGALPATYTDYTGGDFYMLAKDTGVRHYIGGFRYNYQSPGNYVLAANTYSARLLPGTYDLIYSRNCSATTSCFNNVDSSLGPMVNGYRLIAANVVVSGANQTLNIDVPETNLTGTMTLAGGALPPTYTDYTGGDFYLIAKDTGVSHYIGGFRYNYQSPGNYVLAGNTYSARLLPGNYDLIYSRNCSATTSCFNNVDSSLGPMVNGYRVLVAGVTVSGANQTLNIDVPVSNLNGTMTLDGGPLPPAYTDYTGGDFYLIAKDTAVSHYMGGFRYNYQSPGNYVLAGNTYSSRVVPGAYDLVYSRNCSATTSCFNNVDSSLGPMVNGYRILKQCVAAP
ncbi:MAG TPA: hypothetical protein VFF06_04790 [Polyangia bacterium]|nr:hypothetical protein [Polyangia bacterium]